MKLWAKQRKLNSPFSGTLSSYGYTLLLLFYAVHIAHPPLLPNLQPSHSVPRYIHSQNVTTIPLPSSWQSLNPRSIAQILREFFGYFAHGFNYARFGISLARGIQPKEQNGWMIEDAFDRARNVAQSVTRDGLYTIRGEFFELQSC